MPEVDGFRTTTAIRTTEEGTARHIPIIALTSHALKEDPDRCLLAGMDGYVRKPIQQDKLGQEIGRLVGSMSRSLGGPDRLDGDIDLPAAVIKSESLQSTV